MFTFEAAGILSVEGLQNSAFLPATDGIPADRKINRCNYLMTPYHLV